jgi:histidine triad (HIT) family protein
MHQSHSVNENKNCVFCDSPQIKARIIAEDNFAWVFPTNIPITQGHVLISPKRCIQTLAELTDKERLGIFALADRVMEALKKAYGAEGFNCAWNQEKLAGQSVPHFHLHIVPRYENDTGLTGYDPRSFLYRTGERECSSDTELGEVQEKIRSYFK